MEKIVKTPLNDKDVLGLRAGDSVLLTGYIYTARDAAHKRLVDLLDKGEKLPFDVKGQVIYYVGPTSSYRMDPYAPRLLDIGLKGMIGKGLRNEEVINSIKKNCAVYFASIGGAAALTAKCVKSAELIAYEDLGSEAVRKLYVENLPLIVVIDSKGNNFYKEGQEKYLKSLNK